ncbi:signal peptide protein, YSIRK family [Dictyocaulus viviparus]|uniref:Signal peptide protein, YSIRK family n=1 Tax=Dictyocaulus viviparus TaxID=29172 RepID=A0A0D8Y843_DICVI|nr:signal peptide protein, YSIRK family [Dictyocaulus viviparus]
MRDESEQLFKDVKKKKVDSVTVQTFIDASDSIENVCESQNATNLHEISFDIEIRAAIPAKSKVGVAVAAVKHHLVRSLTARAELQYESMDVVEEAIAAPCSVHQMPRSATTVLHSHPAILFTDYLFESDTVEDAQKNFDELLGLKVNKGKLLGTQLNRQFSSRDYIDDGWERCLELNEMEMVRAPLDDTPVVNFKRKSSIGSTCSLLAALSVIIAIVSIESDT